MIKSEVDWNHDKTFSFGEIISLNSEGGVYILLTELFNNNGTPSWEGVVLAAPDLGCSKHIGEIVKIESSDIQHFRGTIKLTQE